MIEIVSDIVKALNKQSLVEGEPIHRCVMNAIEDSPSFWYTDYPIAVVHKKVRIKEAEMLKKFENEGLLDAEGVTPSEYTEEQLEFLKSHTPDYVKVANLMCMKKEDNSLPTFQSKRENDYWKKLVDRENFKAVVEFSLFGQDTDICTIEKVGRDIMRSRKEVYTVRELGFVWVVEVNPLVNLDAIFQLYFGENYITLTHEESKYFIGWNEKLQEINMRDFVCPPA